MKKTLSKKAKAFKVLSDPTPPQALLAPGPKVSKALTSEAQKKASEPLLQLALEGQFAEIIKRLSGKNEVFSLCLLAHAYAQLAETEEAKKILKRLEPTNLDLICLFFFKLAESRVLSAQGLWKESLDSALLANNLSGTLERKDLSLETEYEIAIGYIETARIFLALDLLQKLVNDAQTPRYRKQLAAVRLAWLLFDLGKTEALRELKALIPESYLPRLLMALEVIDGNLSLARTFVLQGSPPPIESNEVNLLVSQIIHAFCVLGSEDDIKLLQNSWIREKLEEWLHSDNAVVRLSAEKCLSALGIDCKQHTEVPRPASSWKAELRLLSLECLGEMRRNPEKALKIIQEQIVPFSHSLWLKHPFVPSLQENRLTPETPWTKALEKKLGLSRPQDLEEAEVTLRGSMVEYKNGKSLTSLDLGKSPVSIKLLQILAGPKGKTHNKSHVHQSLTRSSYSSTLHDARLLVLMGRLEKKLRQAGIPALWQMPRNNTITLNQKITTEE